VAVPASVSRRRPINKVDVESCGSFVELCRAIINADVAKKGDEQCLEAARPKFAK
jgi:hypothetical protein